MSFILEALKRSENERQRQSGPALASAPGGAHGPTRSPWVTIIAALLLLNAAVLAYLLLRPDAPSAGATPAATETVRTTATEATSAPEIAVPRPEPARLADPAGSPTAAASSSPSMAREPDAAAAIPPRPRGAVRSLIEEVSVRPQPGDTPPPGVSASARETPSSEPIVREYTNLPSTPVETAAPAPRPARPAPSGESLPTAQDLALRGELTGLPLHLDLHVYYADPTRRMVFVNGRKYLEGDRLDAGPTVDEIVPEGVILDRGGQRFLLPAE